MSVTKSLLNRHETEIFEAIEKEDTNGINVRRLQEKYGFSPNTLIKYLDTLENSHKLIYSEKIKNSLIYKVRRENDLTRLETEEFVNTTISDIKRMVFGALDRAEKMSIAEQMEVHQQAVNVLLLLRYIKKFHEDISGHSWPDDVNKFFIELDEVMKKVNQKVNIVLSPLVMYPLMKSLDESMTFLEKIEKGGKVHKSKHIKKIEPAMNEALRSVHDELDKLDKKGFFDDVKSKDKLTEK